MLKYSFHCGCVRSIPATTQAVPTGSTGRTRSCQPISAGV